MTKTDQLLIEYDAANAYMLEAQRDRDPQYAIRARLYQQQTERKLRFLKLSNKNMLTSELS